MYKINFKKPIHIHFIGIGGISMSGLAEILLKEGFTVSGSDSRKSPLTQQLEDKGARIFYGQKAGNIIDGIECVVYTAAISRDNPELIEAVARKIPMLTRAELLGQLMKNYKTSHCRFRNTWEDHNHLHDFPYSPGRRSGPNHIGWRHSAGHRRQHPCR